MGSPFYRLHKTSRWRPNQQPGLLSVDRPVDRPTVKFLTVGPAVDRVLDTESRALYRSTARSTGAISREQNSLAVDRVGRPALQPNKPCTFCARRSTARSSGLCFLEQSPEPLICPLQQKFLVIKSVHQKQRRRLTKNVNFKESYLASLPGNGAKI